MTNEDVPLPRAHTSRPDTTGAEATEVTDSAETIRAGADAARSLLVENLQALLGVAILAGLLTWITLDAYGGWVGWTLFVLGMLAAPAAGVLLELPVALWMLWRTRRSHPRRSRTIGKGVGW